MPKKAPQDRKRKEPTSVRQWKSGKTAELEVPSGNVCLVRKPDGIRAFMAGGTIPNSLMPLVQEALDGGKKSGGLDMKSILGDPEKLNDMMAMIDNITVNTVVEPKVYAAPEDDSDRDEDCLYVDEVDMEDKLFIMNWAMSGVKSLEQFRQETDTNVASLANGEGTESVALEIVGDNGTP